MTKAALAARVKGGEATSKKFAAIRKTKGDKMVVARVTKSNKDWAVAAFGSVDIALTKTRERLTREVC